MAKRQIYYSEFLPALNPTYNAYPNAVTRLINNTSYIVAMASAYINFQVQNNVSPFVGYTYDDGKCRRDIGYVLDAVINDLRYNGNTDVSLIGSFYWFNGIPQIDGDRSQEISTQNYIRDLINNYIFTGVAASPAYQTLVTQNTSGSNAEGGASARITSLYSTLTTIISTGVVATPTAPTAYKAEIQYDGNTEIKKVLLITNVSKNVIIYSFADNTKSGKSIYNFNTKRTRIRLDYNTTLDNMGSTDKLLILVEDPNQFIRPDPTYQDPVEKMRVSLPQSMMDTDFEYSLQGTKWESLELLNNYPSYFLKSNEPQFTSAQITSITGINYSVPGAGASISATALTANGTAGLSLIFSGDSDDSNFFVGFGFNWSLLSVVYSGTFIGTNGYTLFGAGSSQFFSISGNSPAIPGIHFFPGDRRLLEVYANRINVAPLGDQYIYRWRGYNYGGSSGNQNIYELRFLANSNTFYVQCTLANNGVPGGGIANAIQSAYLAPTSFTVSSVSGFVGITGGGNRGALRVVVNTSPTTAFAVMQPVAIRDTLNRTADVTGLIFNVPSALSFDVRAERTITVGTVYNLASTTIYTGGFFVSAPIAFTTIAQVAGTVEMEITFSAAHSLFVGNRIFVTDTGSPTALWVGSFTINKVRSSTVVRYLSDSTASWGASTTVSGAATRVYVRPEGLPVHRFFDGGVSISPNTSSPNAQMIRQTRKYFRYQSGKGIQFSTGILFKPTYDIVSWETITVTSPYTFRITTEVDHGFASSDTYREGAGIFLSGFTVTSGTNLYNNYFRVYQVVDNKSFTVQLSGVPTDLNPAGLPKITVLNWNDAVVRDGMFDEQNGLYFEHDGTELFVCRRNSTTQVPGSVNVTLNNSIVTGVGTRFLSQLREGDYVVIKGVSYIIAQINSDTQIQVAPAIKTLTENGVKIVKTEDLRVRRTDFNLDKFDGAGQSGFVFDPNRMQMIFMDYSWYGAGKVRFGMRAVDGSIVYCHELPQNNINTEAYMRSGNLPGRFEIYNRSKRAVLRTTFTTVSSTFDVYDTDGADFPRVGRALINFETVEYTKGVRGSAGTINGISSTRFTIVNRNVFALATNATASIGDNIFSVNQNCAPSLSHWGVSVMMDGRFDEDKSYLFTAGNRSTLNVPNNAERALISIRTAPSVDNGIGDFYGRRNLTNRSALTLKSVGVSAAGAFIVTVRLNTEAAYFLTDANWTRTGNGSISQYLDHVQLGQTTVGTAGDILFSFFSDAGSGGSFNITNQSVDIIRELGNSILGGNAIYPDGPDILTISVNNITGSAANIRSRISWTESQG